MNDPKISVVIPSYNKIKYISDTLNSIINQKYDNYEVIIQDGGSDDGTLDVIKKTVNKYPKKFRLVSRKDGGQLAAINEGLSRATGDVVTFINADDMYEDGVFKLISALYVENPRAQWFVGGGIVINENNKEIAKIASIYKRFLLKVNSISFLKMTNYIMQPSVFISRSAYKSYGPFTGNSDFVMEYDLWLRLATISMPIVTSRNISRFRIEANTKTKKLFKKILFEDEKIIKRYTGNMLILIMHKFHNLARILIEKFI